VNGVPTYPENALPAFANAAAAGFVLELDVKLTRDGVPVVIHDDTLDRTTNCAGAVKSRTAADIAANCRADVLGSPGSGLPFVPVANPTVPVPTLAEFLALANQAGAGINLEIKNVPTDSDFDLTANFANRVMAVLVASGIPQGHVIVQSFWPPNLAVAKQRWPGVQTSLLTLSQFELLGPPVALLFGYQWVSPSWPTALPIYVQLSHLLGRKVVPYTLDTPAAVQAANAAGVDAVITDDPAMAQAALP
jgi:glycerophosphoryl diester phosphodiesterase